MSHRLPIDPPTSYGATRVWMAGVCLDAVSEQQLCDQVIASLLTGQGGWIATPNIYFLRRAAEDERLYGLLAGATLRVPDGMPLIWANKLGRSVPLTRVTGSSLIYSLAGAAAKHDRTMYILGGRDGAAEGASAELTAHAPGLRIVGAEGPWLSEDLPDHEIEPILQRLEAVQPDIVTIGVGFPKQERFIAMARYRLPRTWFLGCGAAINFAAGYEKRAPQWMQRSGLEWVHRMSSEPRRLGRRYLNDMPYALRLLGISLLHGLRLRKPDEIPLYMSRLVDAFDEINLNETIPDQSDRRPVSPG